jgi:hypothetical protein
MQEGKGGTYYPPFPVLGLASDGNEVFMTAGGGGEKAAKEVPNVVQVHRYEEHTGKMSTIAVMNTEKRCVVYLSYSVFNGLWLAGVGDSCMILELDVPGNRLEQVCEWRCEAAGTKYNCINVARFSPNGDIIATGGTDAQVRLWSARGKELPTLLRSSVKVAKEIKDMDFSPDGTLVATCDDTGVCRLLSVSSGQEYKALTFLNPANNQMLSIRNARFVASMDGSPPALVASASGQRGPAYLVIYSLDGSQIGKVLVDKKPVGAIAVHNSGAKAAVTLVAGGKRIYSLPQLRVLKKADNIHELPAPALEFLGEGTAVSGSGDRCINMFTHIGKKSGGSGRGCLSILYLMVVFVILMLVLFLVFRIGVKGATLQQQHLSASAL